jgi:hypothetical protein
VDAHAIIAAVTKVTETWAKQVRAEERDRRASLRRAEALTRKRRDRISLKDAVFAELETGIQGASGGGRVRYPRRNLYYSVRKLIQKHTAEKLTQKNFDRILAQWEQENGLVPGVYCDPRGYFVEPHTGLIIPLGTRQVEDYSIPAWRYDKILFVEKKGFHELLKLNRIAERYDIGIMCAEGYAVDAAKFLLARAEQSSSMTILCLHDADPYGYNIARCLRNATRIQRTISVIDMGLFLEEAIELGLEPEDFVRSRALPQGLVLNDVEREHFEGTACDWHGGKKLYRCRRVELNDLAADPDRFIQYVEKKLRQHGCAEKLVPPESVVLDRAAAQRTELLREVARAGLAELLKTEGLAAELVRQFAGTVTVEDTPKLLAEWAAGLEPVSWDHHLRGEIDRRVRAVAEEALRGELLVRIRELSARL